MVMVTYLVYDTNYKFAIHGNDYLFTNLLSGILQQSLIFFLMPGYYLPSEAVIYFVMVPVTHLLSNAGFFFFLIPVIQFLSATGLLFAFWFHFFILLLVTCTVQFLLEVIYLLLTSTGYIFAFCYKLLFCFLVNNTYCTCLLVQATFFCLAQVTYLLSDTAKLFPT